MGQAVQKISRGRAGGYALLELVLYLGLVSLVLVSVVLFSAEFVMAKAKAEAVSRNSRSARFALERMAYEIRTADSLDRFSSVFGVSPGILQLDKVNPSLSPTVFAVSDGMLTVRQGGDPAVALLPSGTIVDEFVVTDVSASSRSQAVRVTLTVSGESEGATEFDSTVTVSETVRVWKNDGFTGP